MFENNFKGKKELVKQLAEVYRNIKYSDIADIELKKYRKGSHEEEFVLLTWMNGAFSTANNNMNSLTATARNVARMLDGGVYQNYDYYMEIMTSDEWEEL